MRQPTVRWPRRGCVWCLLSEGSAAEHDASPMRAAGPDIPRKVYETNVTIVGGVRDEPAENCSHGAESAGAALSTS
jgi:hypothetical protein